MPSIFNSNDVQGFTPIPAWSEVVVRGQMAKIPTALQRQDQYGMIMHLEANTLYEVENLCDQLTAQNAAAIIQQTLHSNTLLFTFDSALFKDGADAIQGDRKGNWICKTFQMN